MQALFDDIPAYIYFKDKTGDSFMSAFFYKLSGYGLEGIIVFRRKITLLRLFRQGLLTLPFLYLGRVYSPNDPANISLKISCDLAKLSH